MGKKKKESTQDKLVNLQAATLAAQVANWAAQLEFSKERFRLLEMPQFQQMSQLELDKFAWQKAEATWQRAFQESSLTGTYNGQPTIEWLTEQARMTGVLNGQETLEGKLTNAQIKQMEMEMNLRNQQHLLEVGKFDWAKELEGKQLQLQQELQEASLTGMHRGRATFEREQFEAEQGQQFLQLMSSLQGPSNAFKQFRALQAGQQMGFSEQAGNWLDRYGMGSGQPSAQQVRQNAFNQFGQQAFNQFAADQGMGGVGEATTGQGMMNEDTGATGAQAVPMTIDPATGLTLPPYQPPGVTTAPGTPPPPQGMQPITGPIPGRGFTPDQWNDATRAAVEAWNAAHPGMVADGSQVGYHVTQPTVTQAPGTAPAAPGGPGSNLLGSPELGLTPEAIAQAQQAGVTPEQYTVLREFFSPQAPVDNRTNLSMIKAPSPNMPTSGPFIPQAPAGEAGIYKTGAEPVGPGYTVSPPGTQAPPDAYNYQFSGSGQQQAYPPGISAPVDQAQVSTGYPVTQNQASEMMYSGFDPRKMNARKFASQNPYAQEMAFAAFGDMGWDPQAAQAEFERALPKYGGPTQGSMTRGGF